jgi:hypothetical protein
VDHEGGGLGFCSLLMRQPSGLPASQSKKSAVTVLEEPGLPRLSWKALTLLLYGGG